MLLYLLAQSQIKILSSKWKPDISSLADVLDLIGEAQTLIQSHDALDQLIVKLAERLAVVYITEQLNFSYRSRGGYEMRDPESPVLDLSFFDFPLDS